jgi:hypothetical protein
VDDRGNQNQTEVIAYFPQLLIDKTQRLTGTAFGDSIITATLGNELIYRIRVANF